MRHCSAQLFGQTTSCTSVPCSRHESGLRVNISHLKSSFEYKFGLHHRSFNVWVWSLLAVNSCRLCIMLQEPQQYTLVCFYRAVRIRFCDKAMTPFLVQYIASERPTTIITVIKSTCVSACMNAFPLVVCNIYDYF